MEGGSNRWAGRRGLVPTRGSILPSGARAAVALVKFPGSRLASRASVPAAARTFPRVKRRVSEALEFRANNSMNPGKDHGPFRTTHGDIAGR